MLNFKEFLSEEEQIQISYAPDKNVLENNLNSINSELDSATDILFKNSAVFLNTVRHVLERYGIVLPPGYEVPMLSLEAETSYTIGETGYYLYIVHNLSDDGYTEGYAQIVNEDDLEDLLNIEPGEVTDKGEDMENTASNGMSSFLLRARRTDD